MPPRNCIIIFLLLTLAAASAAQSNKSSGLGQVHGPFWMTEGPTKLQGLADLNGDGRLDLLLRTTAQASIPDRMKAVLSNGAGGYDQEILGLALPIGTLRVVVGEFTGDGLPDLIIETDSSEPNVGRALILCTLNGSGLASGVYSVLAPLGQQLQFVEVADLEGDGDDDLLIMLVDNIGQSLLLWVETQGSGAFAPRPAIVLPAGISRVRMAAEDLDGDGLTDVAFLTPGGIERYRTNLGSTLSSMTTIPHGLPSIGGPTAALAVADIDGDGDLDYLASESAAVGFQVLVAQGSGNFVPGPVTPTTKSNPTSISRSLIGIGDTDGDGVAEVVFHDRVAGASSTDYGVLEFYGAATTAIPFVALSLPFNPASGFALAVWTPRHLIDVDDDGWVDVVGDAGILFGIGLGRPPLQTFSERGSLIDADGDGDLDLVQPTLLRHNDGTGWFETPSLGLSRLPSLPPAGITAINYRFDDGWAEADFDGDGHPDLITSADVTPISGPTRREARLLIGTPDGRLTDQGPAAAGQRILGIADKAMVVADLDSDGDLDIAVPDVLWVNDGNMNFVADTLSSAGYVVIAAAQFDGDPQLELLARPTFTAAIGLFVLDGQPSGLRTLYQLSPSLTGSERIADLDDDGDLDIIYQDYLIAQLLIIRNQGASLAPSWGSAVPIFSLGRVQVGDFDGDQVTDFILGDRFFRNLTPGNLLGFAEVGRLGAMVEDTGDIDGDGDLDFLGGVLQKNRSLSGADTGFGMQYGSGSPGSGGYRPLLGFRGPLRTTSTTAALRLSNCAPGSNGLLFVGLAPDQSPDPMIPSLTSYVDRLNVVVTFPLSLPMTASGPGSIEIDLPFVVQPSWSGISFFMQASFFDPGAAVLYSVTNGLEVHFGN